MQTLSITFPEDLKIALDKEVESEHTKRSTLIQKAVRMYLELKQHKNTRTLLREGYAAMAKETGAIMAEFEHVDNEVWKYVP